MSAIRKFSANEKGQGIVEYTLLIALLAVMSAVLSLGSAHHISSVGNTLNQQLTTAAKSSTNSMVPSRVWE